MDMFFGVLIIGLIILSFVSFMLFVRRLLVNSSSKAENSSELNAKLDRIIELLEKREQG